MQLLNTILLLAVGMLLALGNVWFAAERSTIPLAIDGEVVDTEVRKEKHPGKDDVFLLELDGGRVLQVDRQVADAVEIGAHIEKRVWERTLRVDGRDVELSWSLDYLGMVVAMPAIALVLLVTAAVIRMGM